MSRVEITTPAALPEEGSAESVASPLAPGRIRRPGAGPHLAPDRHRRGPRARRTARPHPLLRTAGARQDHARDADGARDGRAVPHLIGPGAREAGRPGRAAHQPRSRRHPLHRRNPPAPAGTRGVPLSGDGGLPGGRPHQRGPERADHADGDRALHAGGRDHAVSACSRRRCGPASDWSSGSTSIRPRTWRRS